MTEANPLPGPWVWPAATPTEHLRTLTTMYRELPADAALSVPLEVVRVAAAELARTADVERELHEVRAALARVRRWPEVRDFSGPAERAALAHAVLAAGGRVEIPRAALEAATRTGGCDVGDNVVITECSSPDGSAFVYTAWRVEPDDVVVDAQVHESYCDPARCTPADPCTSWSRPDGPDGEATQP